MTILYAVLAVLAFLYSIIVIRVGSGTFSFIIWIVAGLFFGFLFFMAKRGLWDVVPKYVTYVFRGLVAAGLVVFVICLGCIFSQFFSKGDAGADYIIVLGAQMKEWGPSTIYRHRLDAAVEYLNNNPETVVVVTGGQGTNEPVSEGEGGKTYLLQQGISEDRILVEKESEDTSQNIQYALALIDNPDDKQIGIVTNNFHVFRGVMLAKRYTDADVSGISAFTEYLYLPNNVVRECLGILKDVL